MSIDAEGGRAPAAMLEARVAALELAIAGTVMVVLPKHDGERPMRMILRFLALHSHCSADDIATDNLDDRYSTPRLAAFWCMKSATRASDRAIATAMGVGHGTTTNWAFKKAESLRRSDAAFFALTNACLRHVLEETAP